MTMLVVVARDLVAPVDAREVLCLGADPLDGGGGVRGEAGGVQLHDRKPVVAIGDDAGNPSDLPWTMRYPVVPRTSSRRSASRRAAGPYRGDISRVTRIDGSPSNLPSHPYVLRRLCERFRLIPTRTRSLAEGRKRRSRCLVRSQRHSTTLFHSTCAVRSWIDPNC
jgi:hypothetical protein